MRGFVDARAEASADVAHAQLAPADSFDDDAPSPGGAAGGSAAARAALAKSKPRKATR
jgi:hypothetical protein